MPELVYGLTKPWMVTQAELPLHAFNVYNVRERDHDGHHKLLASTRRRRMRNTCHLGGQQFIINVFEQFIVCGTSTSDFGCRSLEGQCQSISTRTRQLRYIDSVRAPCGTIVGEWCGVKVNRNGTREKVQNVGA